MPIKRFSSEEARENGRRGAVKSAEVRRQKKLLRETLLELLRSEIPDDEEGRTYEVGITVALAKRAMSGDPKAYEVIRDTIGEKPVTQVQPDGELRIRWMKADE